MTANRRRRSFCMSDTDPAYLTTPELIDELGERSDALVVLALLKTDDAPNRRKLTIQLTGDPWQLTGMLTDGLDTLRDKMREE